MVFSAGIVALKGVIAIKFQVRKKIKGKT